MAGPKNKTSVRSAQADAGNGKGNASVVKGEMAKCTHFCRRNASRESGVRREKRETLRQIGVKRL